MSVDARNIGRLLLRLLATCALVLLVTVVFVNTPFFSSDRELTTPALALDSPLATARPLPALDSTEDALLSGYLFAPESDAQIHMQEHELEGPCENAGIRLKAALCDNCMLMQGPDLPGEVALIMWVDDKLPEPVVTTTTPHCSQVKPDGRVVASTINMGPGLHIGARSDVSALGKIVTSLNLPYPLEERMSLTLGSWVVQEYRIDQGLNVLGDIRSALLARDWTLPEGQETAKEQLTFLSSEGKMLIITVVKEDSGLSITAMMNNQEEGTS